ncbi:hypothetical protein Zmor_012373 [Zophobas morio]|uniref:Uncharacterized protein n=1 Tax=Zophobas morio TaxID=2755281 RepID=A0AA38HHE8_9CUCU|nr:hypothetical protein Zmor_012373 [Zophobas morio]
MVRQQSFPMRRCSLLSANLSSLSSWSCDTVATRIRRRRLQMSAFNSSGNRLRQNSTSRVDVAVWYAMVKTPSNSATATSSKAKDVEKVISRASKN